MLKHRLLHPEILNVLAAAGHGAKLLITDANYPATTQLGENAATIYLNLAPGVPTATQVLETILTAIPVEAAAVMEPDAGPEPTIFEEFRRLLPDIELESFDRIEFYEEAGSPDTCLQIVTGEQRLYANILLTIGVVAP